MIGAVRYQDWKVAHLSDLTLREIEILELNIAGKTNTASAHQMDVSEKTVEFHLENIYTKLGVRTRLMAGIWALRHGIEVEPREIPSWVCFTDDYTITST